MLLFILFHHIEKDQLQSIPGLNTEKIVDTLNNEETMKKIFPHQDESNNSVAILKFLAGPEAIVVDKFVDEIIRVKPGGNWTQFTDENF